MDRYKETFETWNTIASLYQDKFMDLDIYNETYSIVCHSIAKKNATLLDIGCGPGNITKYLLSTRPDFDIVGKLLIVFQAVFLKDCKLKIPKYLFYYGDRVAFEHTQFNFYFSTQDYLY